MKKTYLIDRLGRVLTRTFGTRPWVALMSRSSTPRIKRAVQTQRLPVLAEWLCMGMTLLAAALPALSVAQPCVDDSAQVTAAATKAMDRVAGMALGETSDSLYVTIYRTHSPSLPSVWAIAVVTHHPIRSTNAGPLYAPPVLRNDRLYVVTLFGDSTALGARDGMGTWSVSIGVNPWFRNLDAGAFPSVDDVLAAADFVGSVCVVRDHGDFASLEWCAPPAGFIAPIAIDVLCMSRVPARWHMKRAIAVSV